MPNKPAPTPPKLARGMRVMVYQLPASGQQPEEAATLVRPSKEVKPACYYPDNGPPRELHMWLVEFADGDIRLRWVCANDLMIS